MRRAPSKGIEALRLARQGRRKPPPGAAEREAAAALYAPAVRVCRVCGCAGGARFADLWAEPDLCAACAAEAL